MPPRHLTAADVAARRLFARKSDLAALDQRVAGLDGVQQDLTGVQQRLSGLPAADALWSRDRPDAGFGTGGEPTWTHTGTGAAVRFAIPGRLCLAPARYVVLIGGVQQAPAAYSLPAASEAILFTEAPPAGEPIVIYAPFYGASA